MLTLERGHTLPVQSGSDLFRLVCAVVDEIQGSFASADASSRAVVETAKNENAVQEWLTEQLTLRANNRYHVHREAEVAKGKLPDILVSAVSGLFEVAIEVKHGGKNWTLATLEQSLRRQLAEDYLRPPGRRHGVLVITHHGHRTWRHQKTKKRLSFDQVIEHLSTVVAESQKREAEAIDIAVKGINATAFAGLAITRRLKGRGARTSATRRGSGRGRRAGAC